VKIPRRDSLIAAFLDGAGAEWDGRSVDDFSSRQVGPPVIVRLKRANSASAGPGSSIHRRNRGARSRPSPDRRDRARRGGSCLAGVHPGAAWRCAAPTIFFGGCRRANLLAEGAAEAVPRQRPRGLDEGTKSVLPAAGLIRRADQECNTIFSMP
jgi:hypothetical protein